MTLRIAITLRLSRADDESTSFAVQERSCLAALTAAGIEGDIRVFEDYGVSGASPLADRKGMPDLMDWQPDYVIAWMIDRYARDVFQFLELIRWADQTGTVLMTADGSLNTRTPTGRMIAVILVALAEWVRKQIIERVTEAHAQRRAMGRLTSGKPPWPYAVEKRADGKYLAEDPEAFELCREAVADLLNGGNVSGSAVGLPFTVNRWRQLLTSVILLGFREYKGKIITADDGVTPIRFGPEVIDAATHAHVQTRLRELSAGERVLRNDSPWLAGMIWCACGAPMDGGTQSKERGSKPTYRCRRGHASILAASVHPEVERAFLTEHGSAPLYHTTYVGGIDHSAELAVLEAQRARIVDAIADVDGPAVKALSARLTAVEARHAELTAAHDPVARAVRTATGADTADAWEGSTAAERRLLLEDVGCRVVIGPASAAGSRMSVTWSD